MENRGRVLRLTQSLLGEDRYRVEMALEGGPLRQIATSEFSFKLTPQDQGDIRWYLEDYLISPKDPGQEIAARVEKRMAEIGTELFKAIFQYNDDTRDIWSAIRNSLNDTRVEISADVEEATSIPWELMRDPKTDMHLALRASVFVRASHQSAQKPIIPRRDSVPIRILLVICRPAGSKDAPFRSVASRLIRGLNAAAREAFQLDVLRPPTFEALADRLRVAKGDGKPYQVVHFDGHGAFLDLAKMFRDFEGKSDKEVEALLAEIFQIDFRRYSPEAMYPENKPRERRRGYLLFNNSESKHNIRLVDGTKLGQLLRDCDVSVLVLNACRSAHAEAPEKPDIASQEGPRDIHAEVRAYGSLAQEVMDAGLAGTVAMRYNIYVVTAAKFVFYLYSALARGQTLGQAVTLGRKQLKDDPMREIAYEPMPLQDWCVPLVYEAAPIKLFPERSEDEAVKIELNPQGGTPKDGIDPALPAQPDVGFFGRDETIQALDRAFDTQSIVLLHAFAGSGKTAAAADFARWYERTGGLTPKGRVLFTSFEQYRPLSRVVDQLEPIYEIIRHSDQPPWLTLNDAQRRAVALQILSDLAILWIWDNVEPVTGFPTGTESAWSDDEQKELADFLRTARDTRAKFLLTSRRDERGWLGDLPRRITIPPMPMQECVQLASALADKHGNQSVDVRDWRPLLRFTEGNPLTIIVVVGQAFRNGLKGREQIESFVDELRKGVAQLDDDPEQGRSSSLTASLRYGFEQAFTEEERKILALLYLFQGFVDADVLRFMGDPEMEWCLTEIRGLTREKGMELLDRAAAVGLMTVCGNGLYSIHPAIPWFLRKLFQLHYPCSTGGESETPDQRATRAFVEAISELGNHYHTQYQQYQAGNRDMIAALAAEEANLLHVRRLARFNGWWKAAIRTMQGLRALYDHTGRWVEWKRLVEEVLPDFVDPETDGPPPGLEEEWNIVTEYWMRLTQREHQWAEAARLQGIRVEWIRKHVASALSIPAHFLNATQRNAIRSLAVSVHDLAQNQMALGQVECERSYSEALGLAELIDDKSVAAACAFNLSRVYCELPDLRDLDQANRWCQKSLELRDECDWLNRARSVGQLGNIALEHFIKARAADASESDRRRHLNQALQQYHDSLDLCPANAIGDLAVIHHQLGLIYRHAEKMECALHHYNQTIQLRESMGDLYEAARTRRNVALTLAHAGRFDNALLYAEAALHRFEAYGHHAAEDIQETKSLIAQIEGDIRKQGGN